MMSKSALELTVSHNCSEMYINDKFHICIPIEQNWLFNFPDPMNNSPGEMSYFLNMYQHLHDGGSYSQLPFDFQPLKNGG